jgi:hypothetical protein
LLIDLEKHKIIDQKRIEKEIVEEYRSGRLAVAVQKLKLSKEAVKSNPLSREEMKKLVQELYIESQDDELPAPIDDPTPEDPVLITASTIKTVIKRLPRKSSNGPSGWTYKLVYQLFNDLKDEAEEYSVIASLFNSIICPGQRNGFNTWWASSRIVFIPKEGVLSKYRPLGIGEVWYRVLARVLIYLQGQLIARSMLPKQIGIGLSGCVEIGTRIVQKCWDEIEGNCDLHYDLKDGYQRTTRKEVYYGLIEKAKNLIGAYRFGYANKTRLVDSQGNLIGYCYGNPRQGDPIGGIYFSVGTVEFYRNVEKLLERIKLDIIQRNSNQNRVFVHHFAFLDDGRINVPLAGLVQAEQGLIDLSIKHNRPISTNKVISVGRNIDSVKLTFQSSAEGCKFLGSPIGTERYRKDWLHQKIDKIINLLKLLDSFDLSARIKYDLIRFCLVQKITHFTRSLDFPIYSDELRHFDDAVDMVIFNSLSLNLLVDTEQWLSHIGIYDLCQPILGPWNISIFRYTWIC